MRKFFGGGEVVKRSILLSFSVLLTAFVLLIQSLLAIQDDYSDLLQNYKQSLRNYHRGYVTNTSKCPIPTEGYTVIDVLNKNDNHSLVWRVSDKFNPDKAQYDNLLYQNQELDSKKIKVWEKIEGMLPDQNYPNYVNSYKNDLNYRLYGEDNDNLRSEEYRFPFTALGYTYNWHNYYPQRPDCLRDLEHVGGSEFVVKGGSEYELDGVYVTYDYITSEQPKNIFKID